MRILFIERTTGGRRLFTNLYLPKREGHAVIYASSPTPDMVVIEGTPDFEWAEGAKRLAQSTYPGSKVVFLADGSLRQPDQENKLLAIYEKTSRGKRLLNLKAAEMVGCENKFSDLNFEVIYEYKPLAKRAAA